MGCYPSSEAPNAFKLTIPELLQVWAEKPEGTHFKDLEFDHSVETICPDRNHECYDGHFKKAVWMRPHDILKEADYAKIKLFDEINPNDIEQGCLGVCYFLCSLSAIAEFPERLKRVYNNQETNKHGIYSLTFYVNGIPREIVVDDHFPCYENGKPLFSKPKGNELWVLLAEKAWAKLFGNYTVTEAGLMEDALEFLLGAPCSQASTQEKTPEELWDLLSGLDRKNHIIACCTGNNGQEAKVGLVPGHAYTLIGAHEADGVRLFKVRNPWGSFEWNGAYSDSSNLWTDELKRKVGWTDVDDGTFFMTVEDFRSNFDRVSYCFYHDDYHRSYVKRNQANNKGAFYTFELNEPTDIYLYVTQEYQRFHGDGYEYSPVNFLLLKEEDDGLLRKIAGGEQCAVWGDRTVHISDEKPLTLQPGKYIVKVNVKWVQNKTHDYVLVAYAQNPVTLKEVQDADIKKEVVAKYLAHTGRSVQKKKEFENECRVASGWDQNIFYVFAENKGKSTWNLTVTMPKLENAKLGKVNRQESPNQVNLVIKPGSWKVVYAKQVDRTIQCRVSTQYSSTWN